VSDFLVQASDDEHAFSIGLFDLKRARKDCPGNDYIFNYNYNHKPMVGTRLIDEWINMLSRLRVKSEKEKQTHTLFYKTKQNNTARFLYLFGWVALL